MLPRVREALAKAEKARFYKERIHRNTVEALLHKHLDLLEQCRRRSVNRMSDDIGAVRLRVIGLRAEEAALAESDSRMLEAIKHRVDNSRQAFCRDRLKYKSEQAREEFAERHERWRQLEDSEPDWRLPAPPQHPQIRLNKRLLWPSQKSVGHYRRLYRRLVRRPDSRLGEKCIQALREKHCRDEVAERADRAFIEELAGQLNGLSPFVTQLGPADAGALKQRRQQDPKVDKRRFTEKLPPIHEPQPTLSKLLNDQEHQEGLLQLKTRHPRHLALLRQVEQTRLAIRHWELGSSSETLELLKECRELSTDGGTLSNSMASARRRKQRRKRRRHALSGMLPPLPDDAEAEEAASSNLLVDSFDNESAGKEMNRYQQPKKYVIDLLPNEQVVDCRYIRGYEPPEMLLPAEGQSMIDFIFDN